MDEQPLEVHPIDPNEVPIQALANNRTHGHRSQRPRRTTFTQFSSMVNEGIDAQHLLPPLVDIQPPENPPRVHETFCLRSTRSQHAPYPQLAAQLKTSSSLHPTTRKRAPRSRCTNFDAITHPPVLRKMTRQEINTIRRRKARRMQTDEQRAAARAKDALRRRNARLRQTAEQRAIVQANDALRRRNARLRQTAEQRAIAQANDAIRRRNARLRQTPEQRAATRALDAARRKAARQRARQAEVMATDNSGTIQMSQLESVNNPSTPCDSTEMKEIRIDTIIL